MFDNKAGPQWHCYNLHYQHTEWLKKNFIGIMENSCDFCDWCRAELNTCPLWDLLNL